MGRETALKKRLIPVWAVCLIAAVTAALMMAVFRTPAEKAVLQSILPGQWELHAGGGPEGFVFMRNGQAKKLPNDVTIPWCLAYADEKQHQDIWTHPRLVLILGDTVYGIQLGLEGWLVNDGTKHTGIPWSFSLSVGEGGGEYLRVSPAES